MAFTHNRSDLSNWIIHFVHDRNIEFHPNDYAREYQDYPGSIPRYPESFSYSGIPSYEDYISHYSDRMQLCDDERAFGVLKKILYCGFIKSGWSFRNKKATIYGPKPAVCFTEMPLNNLHDYVAQRKNSEYVSCYGIAFKRNELFSLGARPVIYGLTTEHKEANPKDSFAGKGLRTLDSSCGLDLKEQYRYVYTNLHSAKPTDWTHEREWRWADVKEDYDIPAFPFLLDSLKGSLSSIVILVEKDKEVENLLCDLKLYFETGFTFSDDEFRKSTLESCRILSFESIKRGGLSLSQFNLDQLPRMNVTKQFKIAQPSMEVLQKVKQAVSEAGNISYNASKAFYDNAKKDSGGRVLDLCGFAHVVSYSPHSEITQALLNLDLVKTYGYDYQLWLKSYPDQSISVAEAGMEAAAKFLTETLGQTFYSHSELD